MVSSQELMDLTVLLDTFYGASVIRVVSKQQYALMGYRADTIVEVPVEEGCVCTCHPDATVAALKLGLKAAAIQRATLDGLLKEATDVQ